MAIRLKLHTATYVGGRPVQAGEVVEVDEGQYFRLASRGDIVAAEEGPPVTDPGSVENRDSEPVEDRDPKPAENPRHRKR